jgi:antitoxin (DNA-binding transcriptional repressor) of toxin-antitoxin stability system
MHKVSKSYLKTHMLRIFRDLEKSGEELIVTDNNRPVLKIVPVKEGKSVGDVFGGLQGKVVFREDIDATTEEEWSER